MLPDEIQEHIRALDHWIEELGRMPKRRSGLSAEERKQLQTVNKAVEQLQHAGVSVPEDLRRLKLKLSARDASDTHDQKVEARLQAIEKVIHALGKSIRAARSVRDQLKSTGQAGTTKKHYGITLLDLLKVGVLSTDDRLELQWLKDGPVLKGKVNADGAVMVKTPEGWQSYASLSTAASRVAGRSLNGWKHWRRVNSDGTETPLEDVRARYLKEEADL